MAAAEMTCPRCKKPLAGGDEGICSACKDELVAAVRDDPAATKIRLQPIAQVALNGWQPGEDLDEALLRGLKSLHPNEAAMLLPAVTRMIELESQQRKEDKKQVLRRLASSVPGPEINFRTSGGLGASPTFTTVTESRVYRINGREGQSLEDLPPEIRRAVEERRPPSERKLSIGCSAALVSVLLALIRRG